LEPVIVSLCPSLGQKTHWLKREFKEPGRRQKNIKMGSHGFETKFPLSDSFKRKKAKEHILALRVFHHAVLSETAHRTASSVFSKPEGKKTQKHPFEYAITVWSPSYYDALSILGTKHALNDQMLQKSRRQKREHKLIA
jgi:hypothetical protein